MIGVNLAGAEFGSAPGVYGYDYIYPTASELDYFKSEGITLIRLPFLWERVQPTLGGSLDAAEVGRIHTFLDEAAARGMQVMLDVHNYGRYDGQVIGSTAVPISAFADFWSKMATEFRGSAGVAGFDLMNEPHDMGGAGVWPAAAQAAVDAIRATGATQNIIVAGDGWSSAGMWQQVNANLAINDALNKIIYEAHIYFDHDNTGTYKGTYDQEGATATTGVTRLQVFEDWLQAHNAKGFIGEFGVPADDPRWLTALDNLVDAMHQDGIDGTAWAAGPWWGNYPLSLEPLNGQDKPQLSILTQYAFDAPAASLATDTTHDNVPSGSVYENVPGGVVGDILLSSGADTTGLSFSVSDQRFQIVSDAAGYHLKLLDGVSLDYETESQITLAVTTTNASGNSNTQNLTVHVLDVAGNTVIGSSANDTIDASHSAPNQPFASSENDTIYGMAGNDTIAGGAAPDRIDGGAGIDTASYASSPSAVTVSLLTGTGHGGDAEGDTLVSIENLIGSGFNDVFEGNSGANRIDGRLGIDTVTYAHSAAGVTINLASTSAQVSGGDASGDVLISIENVIGSAFDDTLTGNSSANILTGAAGNDVLNGGAGADTLIGGTGNDTYVVDNTGDRVIENPGEGIDTVRASVSITLADAVENLTLLGSGNINGTGNGLDNVVIGSSGINVLSGLDGNDQLYGADGNDTLIGGSGADWLDGGNGVDTASYASSAAGVSVSLLTGTGHGGGAEGDTLVSIENVTGSAFNDFFEGNSAANRFDGGAGVDTVSYEHSGAGVTVNLNITTAQSSAGHASGDTLLSIENIVGSAFDDSLTGNSLANVLTGGAGNDTLDGWSGADTMLGGTGNDTYVVDNTGDRVVENPGEGIDTVRATISYTLGDNVENLTLLGSGNYRGTGNAGDNVITGNAGSNVLSGADGNDTLIGGAGNDSLSGGAGNDKFVFAAGFGKDTITDFSPGSDVVQFNSGVFADFQHLVAASVQTGADVVITYDAADIVTLKNVELSGLHAGDFFFT